MDRLVLPGLTALAFALALIQRPGEATSDTKIGLHVDPVSFLGDVAAAWSPTEDLGHVQGGQYGGYLFPMGPFFALGRVLGSRRGSCTGCGSGCPVPWPAWGIVRLMDALAGRPRGAAHLIAGLLFLLNPYVAVFTARTSVTLLGYAALPWLLLCVHRGLRAPRSWWWPAAFALAVACTGGGVNAAVTAWVLLGPLLLARVRVADARGRRARAALVRLADGAADRARGGLVGDPDARAGAPRRRLPALHRAARDDLVDDEPARVPAADGLLDLLPRRRLRRAAAAAVRRRRGVPVRLAGGARRAAGAGGRAQLVRAAAALAGGRVPARARARRPRGDGRRLPGGDAAAARDELHLQPRRAAAVPAHDLQGGAAGGARARGPRRAGGGARGALAARRAAGRCRCSRRSPWPGWRRSRAGRWCAGRRSTRS